MLVEPAFARRVRGIRHADARALERRRWIFATIISIATALWPHTEHGIYDYEADAAGERTSLRQPEGYLALLADFARGAPLKAAYGTAALARP